MDCNKKKITNCLRVVFQNHRPGHAFFQNRNYVLMAGVRISATTVPVNTNLFKFQIAVVGQDMTIEPDWIQPYYCTHQIESPLLKFILTPWSIGKKKIMIECYHKRHWLGKVEFDVQILPLG